MLSVNETDTIANAGQELLEFICKGSNWVSLESLRLHPEERPGQNPAYQRLVGSVRICASVDVTPTLDVYIRIAFRGPSLSPMKAADLLESFVGSRIPLKPNTEWRVEIDGRRWIHFIRPYVGERLEA